MELLYQDGPDEGMGRDFYSWDMRLTNGAVFADGTFEKSGVWNLNEETTHTLPFYHLTNVSGLYGYLDVLPSTGMTAAGTPLTWYIQRGVGRDFETYDTTDFNDDGYTGRQKFLMNVDDLFDDADYFKSISLSLTNGNPAIVIPHSKADRRYSLHATQTLSPADWTSPTNSLGTGGTLTLEVPDDESPTRFFKATVELP